MRLIVAALFGLLSLPSHAFEPGSLGDHYHDTGHVQGCSETGELPACTIIAGGSRFVIPLYGPTPPEMLQKLKMLAPLTFVEFRGDILTVTDSYAEFALGAIAEADAADDPQGALLRVMQGEWVSVDDAKSRAQVTGLIWTDIYDGEEMGSWVMFIGEGCSDGSTATGTVLELFPIGPQDSATYCYSSLSVDEGRMELTYAARGNTLAFVAAD